MTILTILIVAALVLGIVAVVEAKGRSWAGWGVICLALYHLSSLL